MTARTDATALLSQSKTSGGLTLNVPRPVKDQIEHLAGRRFTVTLTEEGILYTLAEDLGPPPAWAKP